MSDRVHPRVSESPPESNEPPKKSCDHRCRRCCYATIILMILIPAVIAAAGGIFYLIVRPTVPSFSVPRVSVKGINLVISTANVEISPAINVTVKVDNGNRKVGVYYEKGSFVSVYYGDVKLCQGELPVFYQSPMNVTVFATELAGGKIVLSSDVVEKLGEEQKKGKVGLRIHVKLPVRVRVGRITTWKLVGKGECEVAVSQLTVKAKVVSKDCKVRLHLS